MATGSADIPVRAYDAVVIGAGPAGGVSAAVLAARGMRTLLVDRARFPRRKLCGGCLAPAGVGVLERLGINGEVTSRAHPLETLRIFTLGASHDLPIKRYVTVERSAFDQAIVEAAVARGVEFRDGLGARVQGDDSVRLDVAGREEVLRPEVVVVADGLGGSSLSERMDFTPRVSKASVVGVGTLLAARPSSADHDAITMVCGRHGYVGLAPAPGGLWSLAAALDPGHVREQGPLAALQNVLGESELPLPEIAKGQLRGVGNMTRRRRYASGRVLVVGDAASYVQPLTGEGMSWAMACAAEIGPIAEAAARGERVEHRWRRARARVLLGRRLACRAVCAVAARPRALRCVLGVGEATAFGGWMSRRLCWGPP